MPKTVVTAAVRDVEAWLKFKPELIAQMPLLVFREASRIWRSPPVRPSVAPSRELTQDACLGWNTWEGDFPDGERLQPVILTGSAVLTRGEARSTHREVHAHGRVDRSTPDGPARHLDHGERWPGARANERS